MGKKYPRNQVRLARAEKANPAYAGLSTGFSDLPSAITMPRNYKAFAKEGYGGSDTVYKVIRYISTNGAAIPPKLYTDDTREKEIPASHPLLQRLKKPNPEQTGVDLREEMLGYYLLAGNAYLYAIRNGTSAPPDELWALQPDKVTILAAKTRGIAGYQYADFEQPIDPFNIGRMKTWNPIDPLVGMSALEPGAIMVDMQTAAKKWNLALMQNSGKMPGVWTTPAPMQKTDRDQLEAKVNAKYSGPQNAGKSPVLDGGLTWQGTAVPPSDMDWLESQKYNAGGLANLYDMPPQLIGDTSSTTYDNFEQAKVGSYTEAIFPALDKFYAMLNMWLVPMYPDLRNGAYLYYDKESVEVIQKLLQEQKTAQADRGVKSYFQGACTLNQSLEAQGLPDIGPAGNVYRIGSVLVPADKLQDYAEQSLKEPAAPPKPQPEPIEAAPAPMQGQEPPQAQPQDAPPQKRLLRVPRRKSVDGAVTHILWQCDPDACDFCSENDNVLMPVGEAFPNGCTDPSDSHRFCKCTAVQLSIPDDADVEHMDADSLINWFLVGMLEARHQQDVIERNRERAAQGLPPLPLDDSDEEDDSGVTYAKPKKDLDLDERRRRREEFRRFREATLG